MIKYLNLFTDTNIISTEADILDRENFDDIKFCEGKIADDVTTPSVDIEQTADKECKGCQFEDSQEGMNIIV